MCSEMALQELRQAMHLTQQEIADLLQMNQAAVSKLEHQSDMYVSTLRRFVAALGGELRIVAHFPQGDVVINQFEEIREQEPADSTT
jgi:transcriptional regulator with XRE-family HTH domain